MRRYRLTAFFLALLLALSACAGGEGGDAAAPGSGSSSPGTGSQPVQAPRAVPFTLAVYPAYSLHPALAVNRANLTLAPLLYEGLFTVDGSFQAQPVLCRSYTASEDKLTWTFILRTGVTFSDGTPLTGQAVADALELARSGRYSQRLAQVASITAPEDNPGAVVMTLSRPNGALPLLLDIPIALGDGERPAGTGPYVLAGTGDQLSLAAREGWWQGEKALPAQQIPLRAVERSDQLIYAFDAGDVSLVDVDLMATNSMGYGGNYQTWDYATTDLLYLGFNTREGVCRDQEFRRALALAMDRAAIAQTVYASHAVAAALPVHPHSPLYDREAAERLSYHPEELAAQVEGLRERDRAVVFLVNSENTAKASTAQRIAYQLEAAGLAVELRQLPFEDYAAALAKGDFDLYLGETALTADFDLAPLLASAGSLNYGRWQDEETDQLAAALQRAGEEARPQAASALFAHLDQACPIAPVAFKNGSVLTQWGRVSGLAPVRGDVFHGLEHWSVS